MDRQQDKKNQDALKAAREWLARSVTELDYIERHDGTSSSNLSQDVTETAKQLVAVRSAHQSQKDYRDRLLRAVDNLNEELRDSWEIAEQLEQTLDAYLNCRQNNY